MDIEEAFAIMHSSLNQKQMQHHDKCHHGLSTWFPKMDCRQCELLEIIDKFIAQALALSAEIARLERLYANGFQS